MTKTASLTTPSAIDLLGDYIAGVSKFPEKFGQIAANQRSSEVSLGRAAAALRSMGALNRRHQDSGLRKLHPKDENAAGASC